MEMKRTFDYKGRTYTVTYSDEELNLGFVRIYLHRLPEQRRYFWNFKKDEIGRFLVDFDERPIGEAVYSRIDEYWKTVRVDDEKNQEIQDFFSKHLTIK